MDWVSLLNWTSGLTLALCLVVMAFEFRRLAAMQIANPLLLMMSTVAIWATGDAMASLATDSAQKNAGLFLMYSGIAFLPAAWWTLGLAWARDVGGGTLAAEGRFRRLPFAFAWLCWLMMATNGWHGQFIEPVIGGRNRFGPLWWLMAIGSWALISASNVVVLGVMREHDSQQIRRQGWALVTASGVIIAASLTYTLLKPTPNATLPVLALAGVILLAAVYRHGLFGMLPTALPVLFDNDPDGLIVVRPDGLLLHANDAARRLLAPARLLAGCDAIEVLVPALGRDAEASARRDAWRRELASLRPHSTEIMVTLDGRDTKLLRVLAHPVLGSDERARAWAIRLRDVTAEDEAAAEVRRARRLESVAELARGVAHDFNNVLSVLRGEAHLLAEDASDPDGDLACRARRMERMVERAGELSEQLQHYAGDADPLREHADLNELAADACDMIDPAGNGFEVPGELHEPRPGAQITLDLTLATQPLLREVDPTQVRQGLLNLLVNAREALASCGGRIEVATAMAYLDPASLRGLVVGHGEPAGVYAFVSVTDSGPGVSQEDQERIFEPFFSTKGKRRGMGLSTVLGVARAHGALLQLESRRGGPTRFALHFPARDGGVAGPARWRSIP